MKETIELLKESNTVWTVLTISTVLAIPSFLFAIITWVKSRVKRELSFDRVTALLADNGEGIADDLKLLYKGNELESIYVSWITIWNSGNQEIRREDIASEHPLCVKCKNKNTILNAKIKIESDTASCFHISQPYEDQIEIEFEFVNKHEGIVLQILHTGKPENLRLTCRIKGGKPLRNIRGNKHLSWLSRLLRRKNTDLTILTVAVVLCLLLFFFALLAEVNIIPKELLYSEPGPVMMIIEAFIMTVMILMYVSILKRRLLLQIPEKLRSNR